MAPAAKHLCSVLDLERRAEERAVEDGRVVFAALAARVYAEARELVEHLGVERAAEPAFIQELGARGDDDRIGAGGGPLIEERGGGGSEKRLAGDAAVRPALRLAPGPGIV